MTTADLTTLALDATATNARLVAAYGEYLASNDVQLPRPTDWTDYVAAAAAKRAEAARLYAITDPRAVRVEANTRDVSYTTAAGKQTWVRAYGGNGVWTVFEVGTARGHVPMTGDLAARLDAAARQSLADRAERLTREAAEDDAAALTSPHHTVLDDATLAAHVARDAGRRERDGLDDGHHARGGVGAVELIRRRIAAAGATADVGAAQTRAEARGEARRHLRPAQARLAAYLRDEARYRANGHDIDAMIAAERERIAEYAAAR